MTIGHVSVNDGKYTVVLNENPFGFGIDVLLRGSPWRTNLAWADPDAKEIIRLLAVELAEARRDLRVLKEEIGYEETDE